MSAKSLVAARNPVNDQIPDLPMVSIITPSLDRVSYIGDVIASVGRQTYERIEHIIVDGGSGDGTIDLLKKLRKSYDFRWISETDTGMYDAINKGLRMSRGSILAYLNTDDLYFPWTVEVAVKAILNNTRSGLVYGDMLILDERSRGVALALYPPFHEGRLQRTNFLGQPTVFFRRSVFEKVGSFDETLRYVGDCDYWLRAASAFPIIKVDDIMALQRNHPETLRSSQAAALQSEVQLVRSRYQRMTGGLARVLQLVDRLYLFIHRRYRLLQFLSALRRSNNPDYAGRWCMFMHKNDSFTFSTRHVLAGLVPFAGRSMLYRMATQVRGSTRNNK
jgi:glycosyltransferase involved in cell wall biosynthesis